MSKQKKTPVLITYTIVFYALWTAFEFFGKGIIDSAVENEVVSQLVKSGIIKNLVWTLPAIGLVHRFGNEVFVSLKEMFCTKVSWGSYLPHFGLFTVYILAGDFLSNGRIAIADTFGINEIIIVLFVGITEEMVFRGWLLNASMDGDKKWLSVIINSLLFLAIHFPSWICKGIFVSSFVSFDFLCVVILSFIFSRTFIKSRNILVPIALHMYWDLLMFMFF